MPGDRFWPTIVLEFGYAEPYDDLKDDVRLLLEGSRGKISKVIITKIEPLGEGETEVQRGFVEMWHLSEGRVKKDGGRKVIFHNYLTPGVTFTNPQLENPFPPPRSHASQKLEITLRDILQSEFANLRDEGWEENHIIALPFDHLRSWIKKATRRHLIQQGV